LLSVVTGPVAKIAIVDNGPKSDELDSLAIKYDKSYITLGTNLGIAKALNAGIEVSLSDGASHIISLDQDSTPCEGMIAER
jgi:GT2 family glycosyltransferase